MQKLTADVFIPHILEIAMRYVFTMIVFLALVVFGCSMGDNSVPTFSDEHLITSPDSLGTIPVLGLEIADDGSFNALGMMGAYELSIDPETATAEMVSKRFASLGQSWVLSGMSFFTIDPCVNCLRIVSVGLTSDGNLLLHFAIDHPFKTGNPDLPPSGINRLDLDLFDVALVIVPEGTSPVNYPLTNGSAYAGFLVNNAGYTTELANLVGDQAAMPYILAVDDNASGTDTFNEFPMGGNSSFDAIFDLRKLTSLSFDLYLTMGYGASAQNLEQRLAPIYFNPEFNRKPAWKVVVIPPQGTDPPAIGNTWQNNDSTTPFNVKVMVFDWQHGVTTIANPPVNSDDIAFASNVASVSVEIPGMTNALPLATTASGGSGKPYDPLVFVVPIKNENLLATGTYTSLVKVTDIRVPSQIPLIGKVDFLINQEVGLSFHAIPEFATYQAFPATVVPGCGPITGSIVNPACPIGNQMDGVRLNFSVVASSANGGAPITRYEIDCDYDGITFTTHAGNSTGIFNNTGPFNVPIPCPYNIPHDFKVAFRATDSCTPPNQTIFATCDVTVSRCCPPPTIEDIEPESGWQGRSDIALAINGTNFFAGPSLGVRLKKAGQVDIIGTDIVRISDRRITCRISIPSNAEDGEWDIEVTNGCASAETKNNAFTVKTLFFEDFSEASDDWFLGSSQWDIFCTTPIVEYSTNPPFGPSGSGNIRLPVSDTLKPNNGGALSTVITPPIDVPSDFTNVYLRVYACSGVMGEAPGYYNSNWKIVESSTPGESPFNSRNAALPPGGEYLLNYIGAGSTIPPINNDSWCFLGPMTGQPGWSNFGGDSFPASLTEYFDLIIPQSFFGKTVKICWQWQTDECGFATGNGYALDDFSLWGQ